MVDNRAVLRKIVSKSHRGEYCNLLVFHAEACAMVTLRGRSIFSRGVPNDLTCDIEDVLLRFMGGKK